MHHYKIWMQILLILTLPEWTPNTASSKFLGIDVAKLIKP